MRNEHSEIVVPVVMEMLEGSWEVHSFFQSRTATYRQENAITPDWEVMLE